MHPVGGRFRKTSVAAFNISLGCNRESKPSVILPVNIQVLGSSPKEIYMRSSNCLPHMSQQKLLMRLGSSAFVFKLAVECSCVYPTV